MLHTSFSCLLALRVLICPVLCASGAAIPGSLNPELIRPAGDGGWVATNSTNRCWCASLLRSGGPSGCSLAENQKADNQEMGNRIAKREDHRPDPLPHPCGCFCFCHTTILLTHKPLAIDPLAVGPNACQPLLRTDFMADSAAAGRGQALKDLCCQRPDLSTGIATCLALGTLLL